MSQGGVVHQFTTLTLPRTVLEWFRHLLILGTCNLDAQIKDLYTSVWTKNIDPVSTVAAAQNKPF